MRHDLGGPALLDCHLAQAVLPYRAGPASHGPGTYPGQSEEAWGAQSTFLPRDPPREMLGLRCDSPVSHTTPSVGGSWGHETRPCGAGGRGGDPRPTDPPPSLAQSEIHSRGPKSKAGLRRATFFFASEAPPPPGTCFNFHSSRGGGSPLDPLPPSPRPPPPLPPQLKCTRKPGFWEHFLVMGKNFSAPSAHAIHCVHIAPCVLHIPCFPDYHAPTLVVSVFQLPGPTVATRKTRRRN